MGQRASTVFAYSADNLNARVMLSAPVKLRHAFEVCVSIPSPIQLALRTRPAKTIDVYPRMVTPNARPTMSAPAINSAYKTSVMSRCDAALT